MYTTMYIEQTCCEAVEKPLNCLEKEQHLFKLDLAQH